MKPAQFTAPAIPALDDDTLTAIVAGSQMVASSLMLNVLLPGGLSHERLAGRYFLARGIDPTPWARTHDWTVALRRALFVAGRRPFPIEDEHQDRWLLTCPITQDLGAVWLAERPAGAAVNLIGPLGNGIQLPQRARHLAVISEPARVVALLPAIHEMLDRGGRVVILLRQTESIDPTLRDLLPFAAEVQQAAPGPDWESGLLEVLRWADIATTALSSQSIPELAHAIRRARLRIERDLVQCVVDARLVCGYGACHACLTPLGNGRWTRACVHGPVFDLADLAARTG